MNWEVCRGPLPKCCLSINKLVAANEDVRLTDVFPPNKFCEAILSTNFGDFPQDEEKRSEEYTNCKVTVLLTKTQNDKDEHELINLTINSIAEEGEFVHIVHAFHEDLFVPKNRIYFEIDTTQVMDDQPLKLKVELRPVR